MAKLNFYTPTILDEAFIFTMGASVKTNSNPIGFFGTGLKYAIAVTLRLKGTIEIRTPDCLYQFEVRDETIRDTTVPMVYCNKQHRFEHDTSLRCPMTADYGKTWQPWMALREIYSNTIDEQGEIYEDEPLIPESGSFTLVTIDCNEIYDAWQVKDQYFINKKRVPIYVDKDQELQIFSGSNNALFYRGIRVTKSNVDAALTYNMGHSLTLTEDRTVEVYGIGHNIVSAMCRCDNRLLLDTVIQGAQRPNSFESRLPWSAWKQELLENEVFIDAATDEYIRDPDSMNQDLRSLVVEARLREDSDMVYPIVRLDQKELDLFNSYLKTLADVGIKFDDVKFSFTEKMPNHQYALALLQKKKIILNINSTIRRQGDGKMQTLMTLVEEWIHLTFGVTDGTRQMQERYNEVIYQLITRGKVGAGKLDRDLPF